MATTFSNDDLKEVEWNGVSWKEVYINGVLVWKREHIIIVNSTLQSGYSLAVVDETEYRHEGYSSLDLSGTTMHVNVVAVDDSDELTNGYFHTSNYFTAFGQTVTLSTTMTKDGANVDAIRWDSAYMRVRDTNGNLVTLGNISTEGGTNTFTMPNDGKEYRLEIYFKAYGTSGWNCIRKFTINTLTIR